MNNRDGKKAGIIGLGKMGAAMAGTLLRRGFDVYAFDTCELAMRKASARGVKLLGSNNEVFVQCHVTILSLPTELVVHEVVLGPGGLAECDTKGKIIIDTSTTTASMAEKVAARMAELGCGFLDAPVSGGTTGAEDGTLTIMIGGDAGIFRSQLDVFEAIGARVVYIGPSGHGQVCKMVNQLLMGAIYTSANEAFALAAQCGADISRIYEAVEVGGGKSGLLSGMKEHMLTGVVSENKGLAQHGKDIDYVIEEAACRGISLPVTSSVHEFFNIARSMGFGGIGPGEMWAVWEKILGLKFTRTIRSDQSETVKKASD